MGKFADVPDHHPHAEGINKVAALGLMVGVGERGGGERNYFQPGSTVTRGQLATVMARLLDVQFGEGEDNG